MGPPECDSIDDRPRIDVLGQTMRQTAGFGYRHVRAVRHRPIGLAWMLAFPAAFYLVTISTFIDFTSIPESYHGAVRATTALSYGVFGAVLVSLTTVSGGLVSDLEAGRNGIYRAIGVRPIADLLGRIGSTLLVAGLSVGIVIVVSLATGAEYAMTTSGLAIVPVSFVASVLPWVIVAYAIAIATNSRRYATLVAVSLALASYFATGFNGTVPAMFTADPVWLNVLPNTLSTRVLVAHTVGIEDAVGAGLAPPDLPTARRSLAILCGYAIASIVGLYAISARRLYGGGFR
ncbi:MAG: hypothetical protein ACQETB_01370 [Halobacteriota archaeon]